MSQRSRFFDSVGGDRIYGSDAWAQVLSAISGDGIIPVGDALSVIEASPPSMNVRVNLGAAFVRGYFFEVHTTLETLALSAAHATNPRIDRIVVRRDLAARTMTLAVLAGAAAATPVAPALTQTVGGVYELSLAQVRVNAAVASVNTSNITDERSFAEAAVSLEHSGDIKMTGRTTAPLGWLLCQGQALNRTTYARLFSAISTTFGIGDGSTTFNVPDLRGRFPIGKSASGTGSTLGGVGGAIDHVHTGPSHTHTGPSHTHTNPSTGQPVNGGGSGASAVGSGHTHAVGNSGSSGTANTGSSGTANTGINNPPFQAVNYIIKA